MSKQDSFENTIKSYLDERAKTDELFAKSYAKPNKNIKECCNYILGEAKKRGNAVCISDNEVFGMAVHYFDEDSIKINKLPANTRTSVSAPDQILSSAVIKTVTVEKSKKQTKREEDPRQMSLF